MMYSIAMTISGNILCDKTSLDVDSFFCSHRGILFYQHFRAKNYINAIEKAIKLFRNVLDNPLEYKNQKYLEKRDQRELWPNDGQIKTLKDAHRILIEKALDSSSTKIEAAQKLGINRRTLYHHIDKYGIKK